MPKTKDDMDCRLIRENLFAYHDGQLPDEQRKAFEGHLNNCPSCAAVAAGFGRTIAAIEEKKNIDADPYAASRAIGRLESLLEQERSQRKPAFMPALQPVLASLLLMVAVAMGIAIGRNALSRSQQETAKEQDIRTIRNDLFITELMDEDKTFFLNE